MRITAAKIACFTLCSALTFGAACPAPGGAPAGLDASPDAPADAMLADGAVDTSPSPDAAADVALPETSKDVLLAPVAALTVATWNIENFPKNSKTMGRVAGIILERQFDLVAIQELSEPSDFEALVDALPGYSGILNDDPGAWLRVGFIYRTAALTLDWSITAFEQDGWAFPRPPLVAAFSAPREDGSVAFDFVAMVLHLKAQIDPESRGRRREACEKLNYWLTEQLTLGDEQDYIVLGDWNAKLLDEPQWNVFTALLDKPDTYYFLTMAAAKANDISYLPFPGLIDHVMITKDALAELNGGITEVYRLDATETNYEWDISDHLPVVTTFELK